MFNPFNSSAPVGYMKIESDIDGKILKVLVEDSTPVEFDEPLFLIEPI